MNKPLIFEPMTAFTDLLIFGLGVYYTKEVYGIYTERLMDVHFYFSWVFLFMGLAGLFGALSHGIGPHLPESIHTFLWRMTLYSIGFISFAMALGGLYHILPFSTMEWFRWLPFIVLIIFTMVITRHDDFKTVVLFYLPTIILLMGIMLYSYLRFDREGTGFILISVLAAFVGAFVQQSGMSFHKHFNHNDIYHVIQMMSMYFLYRGVFLLSDFGSPIK